MEATGRTGPKYRHIADDLRTRIDAGEFGEAGQIPSRSELHAHYGAAINTVERAIEELRREGRLVTAHGSGTFVRKPAETEADDRDEILARLKTHEARIEAAELDIREFYAKSGHDQPSHQQDSRKARHEHAG